MSDSCLLIADLTGEKIVKAPGTIDGESCVLRDLVGCSVFLLDYTAEVEVSNCANCKLFIGPVDGPAIFGACSGCEVSVACQQFQAKGCADCHFSLYCATGPSISASNAIRFSCWAGAYPSLTTHFAAANLDPTKNQWTKVYDASALPEGSAPNFTLDSDPAPAWEVPIDDSPAAPENPVPGPNGAMYQPGPAPSAGAAHEASSAASAAPLDAFFAADEEEFGAAPEAQSAAFPTENGNHQTAADEAAGYGVAAPSTADARQRVQSRLAAQAREEADKKAAAADKAAKYLQVFYDQRNATKEERIAQGRVESAGRGGAAEAGPLGSRRWERAISMIDFNMPRPNATDLSRFKAVLFGCKEREAAD